MFIYRETKLIKQSVVLDTWIKKMDKSYLQIYLSLQKAMLSLDDIEDFSLSDEVRDVMDFVWYKLSKEEIEQLNNKKK